MALISSRSVSVARKKKQSLHHAVLLLPVVALSLWWLLSAPETASRLSKQKSRTSKAHDRDFTKNWPFLPKDDSVQTRSDFLTDKSLRKGAINNTKFLWQLPPKEVKGILFLAHGCHHSMTDWWPKSDETCPECIGLPEEVAIVKIALQELHLVVVTISSLDRTQSRCWSQKDGPIVANILMDTKAYFGSSIPLFAFGASSGGFFCSSILPKAILQSGGRLNGYISQIAATHDASRIPSVFITMNRDRRTEKRAKEVVTAFDKENIPAKHIQLGPLLISPEYFSERIETVDMALSKRMVGELKIANIIDKDGILLDDPRRCNWRSAIAQTASEISDSLVADESPLSEVINVAWGMHEMARDGVKDALGFLLNSN
eukprot:scaffold9605_cov45-Attheya_sp.AAC.5